MNPANRKTTDFLAIAGLIASLFVAAGCGGNPRSVDGKKPADFIADLEGKNALPALAANGLFAHLAPLDAPREGGFYYRLLHVFTLLALMALLRVKTVEALRRAMREAFAERRRSKRPWRWSGMKFMMSLRTAEKWSDAEREQAITEVKKLLAKLKG